MSDKLRKWIPLATLFTLYLVIGSAKVILTTASPYYDPEDETNLHFTENAVQYRYARMIAEGTGIPENDTRIQHPEGLRVDEELTVTLECVSGSLYRILAFFGYDTPFHTYSVYFISFFSSLTVFPLYLVGCRLWGGWIGGILVVCFYAVMPPAWMRSITSFSREDFTLTFLFTGLACFGLSQGRHRERWMPWLAGVALSLAAISWHITNSIAWSLAFPPGPFRPSLRSLFMAKLAGEAVNQLTPLANIGGEPLKAYLLKRQSPASRGLASVVINKMAQIITGLIFTAMGLGLIILYWDLPRALPLLQRRRGGLCPARCGGCGGGVRRGGGGGLPLGLPARPHGQWRPGAP